MRKKILYIQHAGGLGGSANSLLYTMQALDPGKYEPVVALARPVQDLEDFYNNAGFETIPWDGMTLWDHSTVAGKPLCNPLSWIHCWQVWRHWEKTQRRTLELVDYVKPDIVHLNSMPLSPCADILNREGIPFVWHVREPPPDQGIRTRMIRRIMLRNKWIIFISEYDRKMWVEDKVGFIVKNFVDFNTFRSGQDKVAAREKLSLETDDKVILYLGGVSKTKGMKFLLDALKLLRRKIPDLICLMPGAQIGPPSSWKSWLARKILPLWNLKMMRLIRLYELEPVTRLMPYVNNIPDMMAASDVLVFPASQPHFARPVIEAAAMGKASVGSDLGGINELIEHEVTGLLVKPDVPEALASALEKLLLDSEKAELLGNNAYLKARKEFEIKSQIKK
ncbi:MAG: glycosyltransferase family 4 protein [Victivallales bacterium]